MKLYHSPTSPYVRKVMIVLHMAGLADKVELSAGGGSPLEPNPHTVGANPLGKVPCLVTDGGEAIFDSRVICRYLADLGGLDLYPSGAELWTTLTREALADGILDAAILAVYEMRLRPEEMVFRPWIDGQLDKVQRAIAVLEGEAGMLAGPPRIDQVAVGAALGYIDFRFGASDWRAVAPKLSAWFEDYAATEPMKATEPKG